MNHTLGKNQIYELTLTDTDSFYLSFNLPGHNEDKRKTDINVFFEI